VHLGLYLFFCGPLDFLLGKFVPKITNFDDFGGRNLAFSARDSGYVMATYKLSYNYYYYNLCLARSSISRQQSATDAHCAGERYIDARSATCRSCCAWRDEGRGCVYTCLHRTLSCRQSSTAARRGQVLLRRCPPSALLAVWGWFACDDFDGRHLQNLMTLNMERQAEVSTSGYNFRVALPVTLPNH